MSLAVVVRKCVHGAYRAKPKVCLSVFGVMEFPLKMGGGTPAACSFPGENARSWEALGEARQGKSSLKAGALCTALSGWRWHGGQDTHRELRAPLLPRKQK